MDKQHAVSALGTELYFTAWTCRIELSVSIPTDESMTVSWRLCMIMPLPDDETVMSWKRVARTCHMLLAVVNKIKAACADLI